MYFLGFSSHSPLISSGYALQMSSRPAYGYSPEDVEYSASEIMDMTSSISPTSVVDSPAQPLDNSNSTLLHNISNIAWLNISNETQTSITLNETITPYQVLFNTVSYSDLI
jgi:hypothetical protein